MSQFNKTNKEFRTNIGVLNNYKKVKQASEQWQNLFLEKKKDYDHIIDKLNARLSQVKDLSQKISDDPDYVVNPFLDEIRFLQELTDVKD